MRRGILFAILVLAIACSPEAPELDADTTWVGTITTEGNVTTVINESGSVWGGTATLVEEASIGVELGADEYMLGGISGVAATDAHIVISDSQVPAVRVYDWAGNYVRDLGRQGQGPGEYTYPAELGVREDGVVVVKDGSRILLFSVEGEVIATWNVSRMMGFTMLEMPLVVAYDGVPFAPLLVDAPSPDSSTWKWAMFPILEGGEAGEPLRVPEVTGEPAMRLQGDEDSIPVPFSPEGVWSFSPAGAFVVGNSAEYRFEIWGGSGSGLAIERTTEAVAVEAAEAAWHRDSTTQRMRRYFDGWVWNGPDVPATKPAYQRLLPDRSGRIWVQRLGPGRRVSDCGTAQPDAAEDSTECWRDEMLLDVFGSEGRFLGELKAPDGTRFFPRPFIREDVVIAVIEDEAGTIMVKRYRLVLPGEEQRAR